MTRRSERAPGPGGHQPPDRGSDRCRDLHRLGHPGLPRALGGVDEESRRPSGWRPSRPMWPTPRSAGAPGRPGRLTDLDGRAQRRPPGPRHPGTARPARHPGHAEHRRPAPGGRQRPGHGSSRSTGPCASWPVSSCGTRTPMPDILDRVRAGDEDPSCTEPTPRGHLLGNPQVGHHQLRSEPRGRGPRAQRGGRSPVRSAAGRGSTLSVYPAAGLVPAAHASGRPHRHRERASRPSTTPWPTSWSGVRSARSSRSSSNPDRRLGSGPVGGSNLPTWSELGGV